MNEPKVQLCVVCAWREHCQKKYSVSKDPRPRCPEFSRDVTIKSEEIPESKTGKSASTPK